MALRAAPHMLIVAPSLVDNNEHELPSGLQVITHHVQARKVFRGVIEHIGAHALPDTEVAVGDVVHYTDFVEIDGMHAVPEQHAIAFDE